MHNKFLQYKSLVELNEIIHKKEAVAKLPSTATYYIKHFENIHRLQKNENKTKASDIINIKKMPP